MPIRSLAVVLLAVSLVLALGGCKPAGAPDPGIATPPPGPAADAAAPSGTALVDDSHVAGLDSQPLDLGEFKIVSVLLGRTLDAEQVVQADRDSFSPRDTIHASVLSTGAHQGLTLSAHWLGPDGASIADTAQVVAPTQPTATTFSLHNPQPWPVGDYKLELAVNEHVLQTREFHVR